MATVTSGKILGLNSLTYLPTNYDPTRSYPILVFLPGAGEIGTDPSKLTVHGPFLYLKQGVDLGIDLIVIAIQNVNQNPRPDEVESYVTAINALYKNTGIIGTGLSRGGQDWEWFANNNETYLSQLKGLVVFSSQGTVSDMPGIPGTFNPYLYVKHNIPIWRGLGDQDFTWPQNYSAHTALAAAAPALDIWTVWKGAGHGDPVWSDGYNPKWTNNQLTKSIYTWAASLAPATGVVTPPPPTTYYNVAVSQMFTKNDCPAGSSSPSISSYGVPAGKYSSTISQADADAQAQADIAANGQAYANTNGICVPNTPPPKTITSIVINYSDGTSETKP